MVWDKSLPNAGHWTDALPDTWLPVDEPVALTSTGLISPMTLSSDNWRKHAGSMATLVGRTRRPGCTRGPGDG